MDKQKYYEYWLCNIPTVGNKSIQRLLENCGTPEEIYHASEKVWQQNLKPAQCAEMAKARENWDLIKEYEKLKEQNIHFVWQKNEQYPKRLRQIHDAPCGLYYKGSLPLEDRISVAVIGARDCSEYGKFVAMELGKCLGENGIQVISGMARGIDSISQQGALETGGSSFAVLGNGVDICYPSQNRCLYEKLPEQGGILSELSPGTLPRPQNFPPRNRIVSGLADVVVVIEARDKSGTLITVDMALEQGKEVYVVPGRITDRLSDGCNQLIKQGAGVLLSPKVFREEIQELWERKNGGCGKKYKSAVLGIKQSVEVKCREYDALPEELRQIYDILDLVPQSVEEITAGLQGGITALQVNTFLMRLCLQNMAIQVSPGHFIRKG